MAQAKSLHIPQALQLNPPCIELSEVLQYVLMFLFWLTANLLDPGTNLMSRTGADGRALRAGGAELACLSTCLAVL